MNIKFLLIGTSLSFLPTLSYAQCVATQDCATLGYTETSCNGGKGVKCPFGNKWACLGVNEEECKQKFCDEYGFTLTCTGTGYAGGAGSACGGKYTSCNCASGYEWKDGGCQKVLNGSQGNLYYCNGVVVAVKTSGMDFYVAMKDLGQMYWDNGYDACQNYSFCDGLKGTMPSREQLLTMYDNKSSLNSLFLTNNGTKLTSDFYWSSTSGGVDYGRRNYYRVSMSTGDVYANYCLNNMYIRPVLENY